MVIKGKKIVVEGNERLLEYFKKNNNILLATVFGSYVDGSFDYRFSDIDIALLFKKHIGLLDEATIMSILSDILNFEKVDLLNLNKANFILRYKAVVKGKILYEADPELRDNYIESILNSYRLHYYRYKKMQNEFLQNIGG